MAIDEKFFNDPEFKKKLYAVDEVVNNLCVDRNRPFPSSEQYKVKRFENGIDCDEVFPGILVGNSGAARSKDYLKSIGVTHVLNCAQGDRFNMVSTDESYYADAGIIFKGLKLDDIWMEDISRTFGESVTFIDEALGRGGKVLIHCLAGISRSATIAIAYLMLRHGQSVESAVMEVRRKRGIRPNEGFLRQLVQLDFQLRLAGKL